MRLAVFRWQSAQVQPPAARQRKDNDPSGARARRLPDDNAAPNATIPALIRRWRIDPERVVRPRNYPDETQSPDEIVWRLRLTKPTNRRRRISPPAGNDATHC